MRIGRISTVYTARRDSGSQSLCGVDIHRIDVQGEVGELLAQTDCAVLAMSAGFMPAYQMVILPITTSSLGAASSIWRCRKGTIMAISLGFGSRFCGGRQGKTLVI